MVKSLKDIFGSRSAELVLLFMYEHGEGHGRHISKKTILSLESIQRRLKLFEKNGVFKSRRIGNVLLYTWNEEDLMSVKLREAVGIAYESIPIDERENLFKEESKQTEKVASLKNLNDFL